MRSSWGQKRVKSAKTLKSARILALLTGNRKKLWSLFNLSQSFENPCRRSSSLVCSCPLWKFPLLIYRRKGGDVHHVVAVGGCRLRLRGISRQFIRRQQRFLFFAKEKKKKQCKKNGNAGKKVWTIVGVFFPVQIGWCISSWHEKWDFLCVLLSFLKNLLTLFFRPAAIRENRGHSKCNL